MAPGRWNAPQENDTVAVAGTAVPSRRSQITLRGPESAGARDRRVVGTGEQGE